MSWGIEKMTSALHMDVAARTGACPDCGHSAEADTDPTGWSDVAAAWVRRLLRMRPLPAECHAYVAERAVSGWGGDTDCGCRHPFHGS
jgi:hypothetical protein